MNVLKKNNTGISLGRFEHLSHDLCGPILYRLSIGQADFLLFILIKII